MAQAWLCLLALSNMDLLRGMGSINFATSPKLAIRGSCNPSEARECRTYEVQGRTLKGAGKPSGTEKAKARNGSGLHAPSAAVALKKKAKDDFRWARRAWRRCVWQGKKGKELSRRHRRGEEESIRLGAFLPLTKSSPAAMPAGYMQVSNRVDAML